MKTPIVLTAFGTTSRALDTYSFIDDMIKDKFPDHEILWAYTSRIVRHKLKKNLSDRIKHPDIVLKELYDKGHKWAVVQSMHLICGHEFYRLVDDADKSKIRTSMGLPLLTSYDDYKDVSTALSLKKTLNENEATILVGHGTDHPAWTSYLALETILKKRYGPDIHVGVIDKKPSKELLIEKIARSGIRQVALLPFMLVAGVHVEEDLAGKENSWEKAFNEKNIVVTVKKKGVGFNKKIIDIFTHHIQHALDVIPESIK